MVRFDGDHEPQHREDHVAVEEPLEIRIEGESFSVTMRTPGDDFDLVAGFLASEGLLTRSEQIAAMRYCAGTDEAGLQTYNVIDVTLGVGAALPDTLQARKVYTTSSCGICGTASIDAVHKAAAFDLHADDTAVRPSVVVGLPDALRDRQRVFERTGGVHAAGLFSADGELLCLREDVGRHNAVDKVIGWALREDRLPLRGTILQLSGRVSFELVQKAQLAGIPVVSAISAPSSLAVELAERAGMTVAGFNRAGSFTVYCGAARLLHR